LEWFKQVPTVKLLTTDQNELLTHPGLDIVYVAVPHLLHEKIYLDVLRSGKDLLAEKPFGIDLESSKRILNAVRESGRFVRCSSEFPFLPGAQRVVQAVRNNSLGRIIEIRAGFLHSSDIDPMKKINWKRQVKTCGESGVMADLGMHVLHIPLCGSDGNRNLSMLFFRILYPKDPTDREQWFRAIRGTMQRLSPGWMSEAAIFR
jgi:predicted dehydrogenase